MRFTWIAALGLLAICGQRVEGACLTSPANCATCTDGTDTCETCDAGFYVDSGNCDNACKVGLNCVTCSDGTTCDTCAAGKYYKDDTSGCTACTTPDNCKTAVTCDGTGTANAVCDVCNDGYYADNDGVCQTCKVGLNCATCSDGTTCATCAAGKYYKDAITGCTACTTPDNCMTAVTCDGTGTANAVCDVCNDGFIADNDGVCQEASPTVCTEANAAEVCSATQECVIADGATEGECQTKEVVVTPTVCTEANAAEKCAATEECVIADGATEGECQTKEVVTPSCVDEKCITCADVAVCTACAQGFQVKDGACAVLPKPQPLALRIETDYDALMADAALLDEVKTAAIEAVATALSIPTEDVTILEVKKGSVIMVFEIANIEDPEAAANTWKAAIAQPTFKLATASGQEFTVDSTYFEVPAPTEAPATEATEAPAEDKDLDEEEDSSAAVAGVSAVVLAVSMLL